MVFHVMSHTFSLACRIVEGDLAGAVLERALADQNAPFVIVVPVTVEHVVCKSAFYLQATVDMIGFVRTVLLAVRIGRLLTLDPVGEIHGLYSIYRVVHVCALCVKQAVDEISAEFAIAFTVSHLDFHFNSVRTVEEISAFAVLFLTFVFDDRLHSAVRIIVLFGSCARREDHQNGEKRYY